MPEYPSMAEDEKKWQAECDARTLSDAEEIKTDEKRYNAAKEAAKKLAEDKMQEAQAASKVAAGIVSYPNSKMAQT